MKPTALLALLLAACSSSSSEPGAPVDGALAGDTASDALAEASGETASEASSETASDASCTLHKAYSSKNAACNGCAQDHCCAVVNGCFDDPRCDDDYVNCILACALLPDDAGPDAGDATGACLDDCAAKHPEGKTAYDAAIACVDAACAAPCK